MEYQVYFSDVINNFLNNEECLENFLDSLNTPELTKLKGLSGELFSDNELVKQVQSDRKIDGFVLSNMYLQVYVISPSHNYIGFWGHRNFFAWRLAHRQSWRNDGVTRYVINFIPDRYENNKCESFTRIKNFYIINIYLENHNECLQNWLDALYVGL